MRPVFLVAAGLAIGACPAAAENFRKLSEAQIRARVAGMEIGDGVHWRDIFERNGSLVSYSMGRKTIGKWRVKSNTLCLDRGNEDSGCYEVWLAGKRVELRREGSKLPLEGDLQKPGAR